MDNNEGTVAEQIDALVKANRRLREYNDRLRFDLERADVREREAVARAEKAEAALGVARHERDKEWSRAEKSERRLLAMHRHTRRKD